MDRLWQKIDRFHQLMARRLSIEAAIRKRRGDSRTADPENQVDTSRLLPVRVSGEANAPEVGHLHNRLLLANERPADDTELKAGQRLAAEIVTKEVDLQETVRPRVARYGVNEFRAHSPTFGYPEADCSGRATPERNAHCTGKPLEADSTLLMASSSSVRRTSPRTPHSAGGSTPVRRPPSRPSKYSTGHRSGPHHHQPVHVQVRHPSFIHWEQIQPMAQQKLPPHPPPSSVPCPSPWQPPAAEFVFASPQAVPATAVAPTSRRNLIQRHTMPENVPVAAVTRGRPFHSPAAVTHLRVPGSPDVFTSRSPRIAPQTGHRTPIHALPQASHPPRPLVALDPSSPHLHARMCGI